MQYWNDIIHTAMLGTGKKTPDSQSLPPAIHEATAQLHLSGDTEEAFLQTAALAFNFRQCSATAMSAPDAAIAPAEKETLSYCSPQSMAVLSDILNVDSMSLLTLWLEACSSNHQIVQPDRIPQLLDIAIHQKNLRTLIASCCGSRGRWLSSFNTAWNFGNTATPEEIWQTGTLQQRVQVLTQMRAAEPVKALEWLQQTWPQEDAATKTELLAVLENNASANDLPFIESLVAEKSKRVKDAATALLQLIPESAIVQTYWKTLQEAVSIKKERGLLGLVTKTKLVVELPPQTNEAIYKSGIEKLSKDIKIISDEQYVLQQLAGRVPPHGWETHLNESKETILQLFQKADGAPFLIEAVGEAAIRFKDASWLQAIIQAGSGETLPAAALPLLPAAEQEQLATRLLAGGSNAAYTTVEAMLSHPAEWSIGITRQIFQYIMNDAWRYNNAFFSQHIHLIPIAIASELDGLQPGNQWQQSYWQKTSQFVKQLLEIKKGIQPSFNS